MTAPALPPDDPQRAQRGRKISAGATVVAAGLMLGLSFAAVPLYRAFCAMTGYGGTTQRVERAPATQGERTLTVRFDSNVGGGLPWRFEAETGEVSVRTGETKTVFYRVTNDSDREISATATYNVTPDQAGIYFSKISCFCFSEQKLGAHETAEWPVVFFLDPALEKDATMAKVDAVTLSYTFFASKPAAIASKPAAIASKPAALEATKDQPKPRS